MDFSGKKSQEEWKRYVNSYKMLLILNMSSRHIYFSIGRIIVDDLIVINGKYLLDRKYSNKLDS